MSEAGPGLGGGRVQTSEEALAELDCPAFFVDRFFLRITGEGARLMFSEQWGLSEHRPRAAVVMSRSNLLQLAEAIHSTLETLERLENEPNAKH